MKMSIKNLKRIIKEAVDAKAVKVSAPRADGAGGFNIRIGKSWHSMHDWGAWARLRKVISDMGSDTENDPWLSNNYEAGDSTDENFVDAPLRANDEESAELERQALIGNLEAAGFTVTAESGKARQRTSGPYR